MENLDLLKQHWKTEGNFKKVPRDELYKIIHKKSSSIVKWIALISIFEFAFWMVIPLISDDEETEGSLLISNLNLDMFFEIISYINYLLIAVFCILFYINYKKIQLNDTSKNLMASIVRVRKTVMTYINLSLFLIILRGVVSMTVYFLKDNQMQDLLDKSREQGKMTIMVIIMIVVSLIVLGIITGIVWLYYRIIYGLLLKKLYRNYDDLKQQFSEE